MFERGTKIQLYPHQEIIYTRWVRLSLQPAQQRTWGPFLTVYLPRTKPHPSRFRLQIHAARFLLVVNPIKKADWYRQRPQHIGGFEFDKPPGP